tara:strand:+ start:274 stop:447 length:174 start_codon:yes stop_codon:yes gene_type:complete
MTAKNNYDYTGSKRSAEHRKRMAESGYKLVQVRAHIDDATKVKDYASKLRKDREETK